MKKSTFASICLSLVLVLGLAAAAQASVWTATDGVGTEYTKKAGTWSSGDVVLTGTNNLFSFDWSAVGSWDGKSDPRTRLTDTSAGKATWDWLTINIYRNGSLYATYKYDDVDNGGNSFDPRKISSNIHFEYSLPLSGTYVFEAIGHTTIDRGLEAESWILNSASVTATPIPAAAWLLGSGLVGLMGFKRSRRNTVA